jgi:hypothetical protein
MVKRVTLDAMIPREDFARQEDETVVNLFGDFPISHLDSVSPYLKLLRKPDFREKQIIGVRIKSKYSSLAS